MEGSMKKDVTKEIGGVIREYRSKQELENTGIQKIHLLIERPQFRR